MSLALEFITQTKQELVGKTCPTRKKPADEELANILLRDVIAAAFPMERYTSDVPPVEVTLTEACNKLRAEYGLPALISNKE